MNTHFGIDIEYEGEGTSSSQGRSNRPTEKKAQRQVKMLSGLHFPPACSWFRCQWHGTHGLGSPHFRCTRDSFRCFPCGP